MDVLFASLCCWQCPRFIGNLIQHRIWIASYHWFSASRLNSGGMIGFVGRPGFRSDGTFIIRSWPLCTLRLWTWLTWRCRDNLHWWLWLRGWCPRLPTFLRFDSGYVFGPDFYCFSVYRIVGNSLIYVYWYPLLRRIHFLAPLNNV